MARISWRVQKTRKNHANIQNSLTEVGPFAIRENRNHQKSSGVVAKIVISRQSCAKTNDVWSIFDTLTNQQPDCYHFLYAPEENSAFLGCSPERLFSISKNKLFTEAIAGTRPIAFAPVEDAHLDRELQNSNKDNVEHNIVTQFISSALEKYSTKISIEPRRILRLKNVKHLQTQKVLQ